MTSTHDDVTPGARSASASKHVLLSPIDAHKLPLTEREVRMVCTSLIGAAVAPWLNYSQLHGAAAGAAFGYVGALVPQMPERPLSEVMALGTLGAASLVLRHCEYSQWLAVPAAFVGYSVATRLVI